MTNLCTTGQITADLYLGEISCMKGNTEKEKKKKIEDAEKKVKKILADGEKKFDILKAAYKSEYAKWQQLRTQNAVLEANKQESCEGIENG
mgnify:CR=1 FL=1